ncbi:putative Fe-s protein assembly co-chaperone [Rosellinia necatrix]|uniref:Putative Fe-s protein assembly co-chaperone n=1 Tax=Rosellinia necatrix TaxID=77044 RepID=A0A1W2TBB5_ROSNE|nr:putative Fe-s protein assembly co-chaperone [Rosellinia necatrix]
MWPSIFPTRQASRVCAFCRQHCQRQPISTTRNLHASSSSSSPIQQQQRPVLINSALAPPSPNQPPHHHHHRPRSTTRRSLTTTTRSGQADANADAKASTKSENNTATEPAPPPQTHYELFPKTLGAGPPPSGPFAIDVRALRREFLALQAGAHPDLHPASERDTAQAASARLNDAFGTLSDPLRRARYVLALRGADVGEAARVEDDAGLLTAVMEAREAIEDAEMEEDLDGLREANEGRIRGCVDRLADLFARDEIGAAREEVVRLRYWVNVREGIDGWERGGKVVLGH